MWPALLFPIVVLAGTLFMERFETAVLVPEPERVGPAASHRGERGKISPLWTITIPQAAAGHDRRARPVADALPSAGGAELKVSSGAVAG